MHSQTMRMSIEISLSSFLPHLKNDFSSKKSRSNIGAIRIQMIESMYNCNMEIPCRNSSEQNESHAVIERYFFRLISHSINKWIFHREYSAHNYCSKTEYSRCVYLYICIYSINIKFIAKVKLKLLFTRRKPHVSLQYSLMRSPI